MTAVMPAIATIRSTPLRDLIEAELGSSKLPYNRTDKCDIVSVLEDLNRKAVASV